MDLDGPRKRVLAGRRSPYSEEFRNDAVALFRAAGGRRTCAAVAADVGVTGETLPSWVRQADEQAGRAHGGEATEEGRGAELARLRAETRRRTHLRGEVGRDGQPLTTNRTVDTEPRPSVFRVKSPHRRRGSIC